MSPTAGAWRHAREQRLDEGLAGLTFVIPEPGSLSLLAIGIEHMERDQSKGDDVIRFRAEAGNMLGLPAPPASQPPTAPTDKQ